MINTLYLPELRELLAKGDAEGLREFCTALHPARTAEFMEGLTVDEAWGVLQHADPETREEIFSFFPPDRMLDILESQDRHAMAGLVAEMAPDDRVDLLQDADDDLVGELLDLMPADERRDIQRLSSYPEGCAGAVMTTEVAKLSQTLSVRDALQELGRLAEDLETIYYLYVVDDTDHLRGVVSARQLVSAMTRPDTHLGELMETDVATANVADDQEAVAQKVAQYNLLAIPVVDNEYRMLGIVTHDDVIDVFVEEATEDALRIAAVEPLEESYMRTSIFTLSRKRGIWLTILFFTALLTAFALQHYESNIASYTWLVLFIPLVISSGGNSGSQSATLIITAMATGDVRLGDWLMVVRRELAMGALLGSFLGTLGFISAWGVTGSPVSAAVVAITLLLVVLAGTSIGSMLPIVFRRLGWDPAMMSNPFVAGIIDILGIIIYMNVGLTLMRLAGIFPDNPVAGG